MATYEIGRLIYHLRTKKGISQDQLCEGLFSTVTLSRVENGTQKLSKENFDAIIQRLGGSERNYLSFFMGADEYEIYERRNRIHDCLYSKEYEKAGELINELENNENCLKGLNFQFLLSAKARVMSQTAAGGSDNADLHRQVMEMLTAAIKITIPKFDETNIRSYLLTDEDITIINSMALTYISLGDINKGIGILSALRDSIENNMMDDSEKANTYVMVLYNLAKYLGQTGKYKESIEAADIGKKACIRSGRNALLPYFIFYKACALYELGDADSCEKMLPQAFYGLYMQEEYKLAKVVKDYAKEKFNMIL